MHQGQSAPAVASRRGHISEMQACLSWITHCTATRIFRSMKCLRAGRS